MTDEGFLLTLVEKPNDDATRLIYADWLEDQGDEESKRKADYIRLDCELAALGAETRRTKRRKGQRQRLAEKIESAWLSVVGKAPIERCTFAFECPKKWENLAQVEGSETTRYCDECKREVYFCETLELARTRLGGPLRRRR